MKFTKTKTKLPKAGLLMDVGNVYYLIIIEGFGIKLAMFLENEKGEKDWYTDYTSKIIRDVTHWCEVIV